MTGTISDDVRMKVVAGRSTDGLRPAVNKVVETRDGLRKILHHLSADGVKTILIWYMTAYNTRPIYNNTTHDPGRGSGHTANNSLTSPQTEREPRKGARTDTSPQTECPCTQSP